MPELVKISNYNRHTPIDTPQKWHPKHEIIVSIASSDKTGMQLFKEDSRIDMYLTAMRLGWSQVASSLPVDMWSSNV